MESIEGEIEFVGPVMNFYEPDYGLITGSGATLRFDNGLTNAKVLAFTFGASHLFGDIVNTETGRIIVTGGGEVTFYDDLTNDGVVQNSDGSKAVYFGSVDGGGSFTGTGTSYFEGDLRPGHSPAIVSFGGDVIIGSAATVEMEIGGTLAGVEHDQIRGIGSLFLYYRKIRLDSS